MCIVVPLLPFLYIAQACSYLLLQKLPSYHPPPFISYFHQFPCPYMPPLPTLFLTSLHVFHLRVSSGASSFLPGRKIPLLSYLRAILLYDWLQVAPERKGILLFFGSLSFSLDLFELASACFRLGGCPRVVAYFLVLTSEAKFMACLTLACNKL